jgi:hypothetical protein
VRDNSTENSSEITTSERDSSLGALAIIRFLARKTVVDHFNNGFKRGEFHHRIWDLTSPERIQALVKTSSAFLCDDRGDTIECAFCEWRNGGLHADLDGFKWAESNIGNEFSGGRGGQVDTGLVFVGILSTNEIGVPLLEELVASVFEGTLSAISEESWRPSSVDSAESFGTSNLPPCLEITSVHLRIDLATTFDKIERCDRRVSETLPTELDHELGQYILIKLEVTATSKGTYTCKQTTESTSSIVLSSIQLNVTSFSLSLCASFFKLLLSFRTQSIRLVFRIIND